MRSDVLQDEDVPTVHVDGRILLGDLRISESLDDVQLLVEPESVVVELEVLKSD